MGNWWSSEAQRTSTTDCESTGNNNELHDKRKLAEIETSSSVQDFKVARDNLQQVTVKDAKQCTSSGSVAPATEAKGTKPQNAGRKRKKKMRKKVNLEKYRYQTGDESKEWPKRLIVFDVNGVLLRRKSARFPNLKQQPAFKCSKHWVYERPYARQLMKWAKRHRGYCIGVWTSSRESDTIGIQKFLFEHEEDTDQGTCAEAKNARSRKSQNQLARNECTFFWTKERCLVRRVDGIVTATKPLARVFDAYKEFDRSNTLLVDDTHAKCIADRANSVHPNSFLATEDHDYEKDDFAPDGKLWQFLDDLARYDGSVPEFLKESQHFL